MRDLILERGPAIRRVILLGLAAGVPLFFLRMTNDVFGVPKLGLLMFGITLVVVLRVAESLQGASLDGLTRLWLPAVVFALPLFLAWAFSPYKYWALFGWYPRLLGLVPYLLVIVYGILVADAFAGRLRELAWALSISGTIVGAYGLLQAIGADPFEWGTAGTGASVANSTLGNSNFAGAFIAMTFPYSIALWTEEKDQRNRLVTMFVLAVGGWIVSLSEGAWVAGTVAIALVVAWGISPRVRWARPAALVSAAGGIALLLGAVVYRMVNPGVVDSITYRGWWWRAAGRMVSNWPIFGRGPAAFAVDGVRYRPFDEAVASRYGFPDDPHAILMALVASAGVLGVAAFLFIFVWTVRRGLVLSGGMQLLPVAFFASVLGYFVNSLTTIDDLSLRVALWTGLAGLAIASIDHGETSRTGPHKAKKKTKNVKRSKGGRAPRRGSRKIQAIPAVVAASLLGLVVAVWSVRFVMADARIHHARILFASEQVDEGRAEFEKAIAFRGDYAYRTLYGLALGEAAIDTGGKGEPLIEAMRSTFSYVHDFPYVPAQADFALRLFRWGEFDPSAYADSLSVYSKALDSDPLNPLLRVQMSDVLLALDRPEEAIELLEGFAPKVGDRAADVWGALALAYLEADRGDEARAAMDRAFSIDAADSHALEVRDALEMDD